jgi:hypothetical protein
LSGQKMEGRKTHFLGRGKILYVPVTRKVSPVDRKLFYVFFQVNDLNIQSINRH